VYKHALATQVHDQREKLQQILLVINNLLHRR